MDTILDPDRGVANVNGNARLFEKLLDEFCTDHHTDATRIRDAMSARDFETAHRIAHTLKGVAGTLGADRISAIAARVDAALKHRRAPEDSDIAELDASLMRLANMVGATARPEASADSPADDIDSSAFVCIREMIEQMSPAAEDHVHSISAGLSAIDEDVTKQLISRLKAFEFEEALDSLTRLERSAVERGMGDER